MPFTSINDIAAVLNDAMYFGVTLTTTTAGGITAAATTAVTISFSNGSGLSHQVWVKVRTESLPNRQSGSSIDLNRQFGYGSMEIHNPSELGVSSVGCPAGPFVDSYNALVFAAW